MEVFTKEISSRDVVVMVPESLRADVFAPPPSLADGASVFVNGFTLLEEGDCINVGIGSLQFGLDSICGSGVGWLVTEDWGVLHPVGEGYMLIPLDVYNAAVTANIEWFSHVAIWSGLAAVVAGFCGWCLAPLLERAIKKWNQ